MNEKPIIFNAESVNAILFKRKTQTRRVIKPQPEIITCHNQGSSGAVNPLYLYIYNKDATYYKNDAEFISEVFVHGGALDKCPYGKKGGKLWIRETFAEFAEIEPKVKYVYKADKTFDTPAKEHLRGNRWTSPLRMPRIASRITLKIENIRVERIQKITNSDAKAEGICGTDWGNGGDYGGDANYLKPFQQLWDTINAKRGFSWLDNPFCWCIEFSVAEANK